MFKFQYQNGKKRKSAKKFYGLQNEAIRGLQIGAGFRDYKSVQNILIDFKVALNLHFFVWLIWYDS